MVIYDLSQGWHLVATLSHCELAARQETATLREIPEIGRLAFDRIEFCLARLVEARHRAEQSESIGMARVVVDRARYRSR